MLPLLLAPLRDPATKILRKRQWSETFRHCDHASYIGTPYRDENHEALRAAPFFVLAPALPRIASLAA